MTAVSAAGEDCVGCGSVLCTEGSKFLSFLLGSSVKYPAMGADHPLPPECRDDQQ